MATPDAGPSIAGDAYGTFIAEQLQRETATKESFERRAVAVITTSGVLVGLLFGLAGAVIGQDDFTAPTTFARVLVVVALALFLVAAVLGILVNAPSERYQEADTRDLRRLTAAGYWEARVRSVHGGSAKFA